MKPHQKLVLEFSDNSLKSLARKCFFSDGKWMVDLTKRISTSAIGLCLLSIGCGSSDYPKTAPGAQPQQNALGVRVSADTLRFLTDNLEQILRKNMTLDETGEYAIIYLAEASDASADTFCDEGTQWPGQVPACSYSVRVRDGCLGPGTQNAITHKCEPNFADRPRESMRSSIRVKITDLAQHIHLEMEDPNEISTGGFRMIIEDLSFDADIGLYTKIPTVFGFSLGDFACRYRSSATSGGQAIKIEKIDISIQPKVEDKDGKPSIFATSLARDIRLASLDLTAEAVSDPSCLTSQQGSLDCASACGVMGTALTVVSDGFNFVNDVLKPALPYIVTPIANAALAFVWGNAMELEVALPTKNLPFIPKGAGRDVRLLASAQPGAFEVNQKGSGSDDPTRGTGLQLSLGAYSELSPCVEQAVAPPLGVSSLPPTLDGTVAIADPLGSSGQTYNEPYHLGLVIGEAFFNQMAYALRNSGMLCVSLGSEPGGLLASGSFVPNAGLLYLLAPPLAALAPANAPIFFRMKPGNTPTVKFGSGKITGKDAKGNPIRDSLVTLTLFDTGVEFHLFAWDRYIRTFALNIDVVVGLTIYPTTDGKLMVSIDSIKADNIVEVFNELMPNYDFSKITEVLFSILSTQLSSNSLSFELPIKDALKSVLGDAMSIRLLDVRNEGSAKDYLGLYVKLCTLADELDPSNRGCSLNPATATREASEVSASAVGFDHIDGTVDLSVTAPGPGRYEYQAAIDSQVFGAFYEPDDRGNIRIQSALLRMLGKHQLSLRPRLLGQPVDLQAPQASVEVMIDPESPRVTIIWDGGTRSITAEDLVTPPERLLFQVIDDENESVWTDNTSATQFLRLASLDAFVLARDEAGNISADPRLLLSDFERGSEARRSEGCSSSNASPLAAALLVLLFLRRRQSLSSV